MRINEKTARTMKEKQEKTVSRKILETIVTIIGTLTLTLLGAGLVSLAGGGPEAFETVEILGALVLAGALVKIWGSKKLRRRWGEKIDNEDNEINKTKVD